MDKKQAIGIVLCALALLVGGWMVVKNIGSGRPSKQDLQSGMGALTTEDLMARRHFMAAQIAEAKAAGPGPRPDLLASAEQSLKELDELLASRGVDVASLVTPDSDTAMQGLRRENP